MRLRRRFYSTSFGKLISSASAQATDAGATPVENRLHIFDRETSTKFLVDSGSVVSLLPRSLMRNKLPPQQLVLYAANSSAIKTYGRHSMTLNLKIRRALTWSFIIADVQTAILGADFLTHYGLLVDLKNRRILDPLTSLSSEGIIHKACIYSISTVDQLDLPSGPERRAYADLLSSFADLASPCGSSALLEGSPVSHTISTTGPPVYERPRRLSGERLTAAKQEFDVLLDRGIIRPSSSQWASPLHLVQKAAGGWRATGDYRRLNAVTVPDRYPLPNIDDLLQDCQDCTVFSTLDLQRAYYQIPVVKEDICKTAVTTPFGLFEFLGMPLGLRNASQTFQRYMDSLLRKLPFVRCYLDDLFVMSRTHEEHLQHLQQLFSVLRQARLSINLQKCCFGKEQVTYLGYLVSKHGFEPPPHKIQAIVDFPKPDSPAALRRFLGMVNFYRRTIPRASLIQAPLHELLKGRAKKDKANLSWTEQANGAFAECKAAIASATRSSFLRDSAPLALTTDASSSAVGAALEQLVDGTWEPLGFFSRKLSDAETQYNVYDRELLAVYAAVNFFRRILEGRTFVIKTDHRPLVFAAAQRSDKASPRQQRQLDFILQFNASFKHIKGTENPVADALSRTCSVSMPSLLDPATICEAQEADIELQHLLAQPTSRLQVLDIDGHSIYCDLLADNTIRPYIPPTLRQTAFNVVHGLSHPSGRLTSRLLTQKFFWPGMKKDATRWARECQPCQRAKIHHHNRAALGDFNTPDNRFDHVHVDLIKMPLVGDLQYCLTIVDRFSRWPTAIPLSNIQASTVAKAFYANWICLYGTPLTITSDQGTQFESALFKALAEVLGSHKVRTTPYHPQSNGMVERFHRSLKAALMCSPHVPWPDLLPSALLGLRTTFKEDLQASPAEMLYGTSLRIPGDFFVTASTPADTLSFVGKLRSLFHTLKAVPGSRHTSRHPFFFKELRDCTHVFKRVASIKKPLEPPYTGPHRIIKRISDQHYVIDFNGEEKSVSTNDLKPAFLEAADSEDVAPGSPPQPRHQTSSPVLPPPPPQRPRKVTFLPAEGSKGGVDVAITPQPPQHAPAPRQPQHPRPRSSRRKQQLAPRPLF